MRCLVLVVCLSVTACAASSDVSRELGARCDDSDECDDRCLRGDRFPDGLCSRSCDDDGDCPSGAACVDLEGGVCLFACKDGQRSCEFLGPTWQCRAEAERGGDAGAEVEVCIAAP